MKNTRRLTLVATVAMSLATSSARAVDYDYHILVSGTFGSLGLPAISNGRVAFYAEGPGTLPGIYLYEGGTVNRVVAGGDRPWLCPSGNLVFRDGVGVSSLINGVVDEIATSSTAVPGGTGTFYRFSAPSMRGVDVAFRALGSGNAGTEEGIYTNAGGALRVVADKGTPIPNGTGNFTSFGPLIGGFELGAIPTINQGTIVFTGSGSGGQQGIYAEIGGTLTRVADLNTRVPSGTGNFTNLQVSFLTAAQIEAGVIYFAGEGAGGQMGIYKKTGNAFSVVLDTNTSGVPFTGIGGQGFGLHEKEVSYLGDTGIFATELGNLGSVIEYSETVEGKSLGNMGTYGQGIYEGIVAFNVDAFGSSDGNQKANIIAMPEYRWTRSGSGQWDAAANWLMGRTPRAAVSTFIEPASTLTISGPAADTILRSLKLGGQTGGLVTLQLSPGVALAVNEETTITIRGKIVGDGQLDARGGISNSGEIDLGASSMQISGGSLVNFGTIRGNGQIDNAVDNRASGEIRIAAGQRQDWTGALGHNNAGRIEVIGNHNVADGLAELEIEAALVSSGTITGRDATLRFRGALNNTGLLALSFGTTDVFGDVDNDGSMVVGGNSQITFFDDITNGGTLDVAGGSTAVFFGSLAGNGNSGTGDVQALGGVMPGFSPGVMQFGGNMSFGPRTELYVEIGGRSAGTEFDVVEISGSASLGGTLNVDLIDGFLPSIGDEFTIATYASHVGSFAATNLPQLGHAGEFWAMDYGDIALSLSVSALPGDIDLDGDVDRTDAALFSQFFGRESGSIWTTGDFDGDEMTTLADWGLLQTHLGQTVPSPSAAPSAVGVPEPAALWLALLALAAIGLRRRR